MRVTQMTMKALRTLAPTSDASTGLVEVLELLADLLNSDDRGVVFHASIALKYITYDEFEDTFQCIFDSGIAPRLVQLVSEHSLRESSSRMRRNVFCVLEYLTSR